MVVIDLSWNQQTNQILFAMNNINIIQVATATENDIEILFHQRKLAQGVAPDWLDKIELSCQVPGTLKLMELLSTV